MCARNVAKNVHEEWSCGWAMEGFIFLIFSLSCFVLIAGIDIKICSGDFVVVLWWD